MIISNGPTTAAVRGHLLLVESARQRTSRRRSRGHGANLGAMSAIPAAYFAPGATGVDVIQVDDAVNPHSVLTRVKAAGRTPGPLVVYISGLLMVDRTGAPHVGLRDSSRHSVRHDGLPWASLTNALGSRSRAETLVIVDFATDTESWTRLRADASVLTRRLPVWGVVSPPSGSADGVSPFTRALSIVLARGDPRVPTHAHPSEIHRAVIERAGLAVDTLELVPDPPGLRLTNAHPGAPIATLAPSPEPVPAHPVEAAPTTSDPTAYMGELIRIRAAGEQGDHTVAILLARDLDTRLATSLGVDHPDSWAAREVHAWAQVAAGRFPQAFELYLDVARRRVRALPPDHATVIGPTDCAHAAWLRITSVDDARRAGPAIVALRELVPGRSGTALRAARRHLEQLRGNSGPAAAVCLMALAQAG